MPNIYYDNEPVEGGPMSPFVVTGDRVGNNVSRFDTNIFSYGQFGGSYTGSGGGMTGTGGVFDPGYQARLDQEALLYFQQQEAAKQARLDEENRLAEEERLAKEAAIAEQARLDALAGNQPASDLVKLDPVVTNGGYVDQVNQNIYNLGLIGPANDPANLGANPNYKSSINKTELTPTDGTVKLDPVTAVTGPDPDMYSGPVLAPSVGTILNTSYTGPSGPFVGPLVNPGNPTKLDPVTADKDTNTSVKLEPAKVDSGPIQLIPSNNPYKGEFVGPLVNPGTPIKLEPVKADPGPLNLIPYTGPSGPFVGPLQFTGTNIKLEPTKTNTATDSTSTTIGGSTLSESGTGTSTGGTGTGQKLTIKRDFGGELAETLAALQKNQPEIMSMYGDLYKQFMPKGITESESGIIDQYKADLGRLQQRQAGVLAPEDVRQSQQAAREAYGARGQVMGRGAVGAEILNREAIRQQREDQARAGLQASYGNVLNMANLQTGNIFSPIGNLMSNTFNPLSPYAADVYGTNVNAQLAKEIAQKNYDAAVRSAELQGSAAKSASNTSLFGDLLKVGGTVKIAMACMPGYQAIDTPNGPVPIENLRGGDYVIGYDNTVKRIEQLCSYVENPETEFLKFALADGGSITVCGPHKILDIPAREWLVGSEMNGVPIVSITKVTGVTTSYDLMTDVGGYRIAGIPVNSMIPEMIAQTIEQVLLNRS